MPYGGPRFEFFTRNQYDNFTASIRKEEAASVRALCARRAAEEEERRNAAVAGEVRAREEAQRVADAEAAADEAVALRRRRLHAEEMDAAATRKRHSLATRYNAGTFTLGSTAPLTPGEAAAAATMTGGARPVPGDGTTQFAGSARVLALSHPKEVEEPAYGGLMYGRCMYQRGERVQFPEGRGGEPYTPGIDRDRLIPRRPDLSTKPWIGSYSTQKETREAPVRRERARYYFGGPRRPRSAAETAVLAAMAAEEAERRRATMGGGAAGRSGSCDGGGRDRDSDGDSEEGRPTSAASIFSHGSSDGPIVATGTQFMIVDPRATKEQVSLHLSRYGGSLTPLGNLYGSSKNNFGHVHPPPVLETMTLPELTNRVLDIQRRRGVVEADPAKE